MALANAKSLAEALGTWGGAEPRGGCSGTRGGLFGRYCVLLALALFLGALVQGSYGRRLKKQEERSSSSVGWCVRVS